MLDARGFTTLPLRRWATGLLFHSKVFGSEDSKDILLSFLNAVLNFPEGRRLTDLAMVDPTTSRS